MAVRLELFAVDGSTVGLDELAGDQLARQADAETAAVGWAGWVSASDDDEQLLVALLDRLAQRTGMFTPHNHAAAALDAGETAALNAALAKVDSGVLDGIAFAASDTAVGVRWLDAIKAAVTATLDEGRSLVWRMRYDRGGTVDDGADEFDTATHFDTP